MKINKLFVCAVIAALTVAQNAPAISKEDESQALSLSAWNDIISLPQGKRPKIALVLGGGGARGLAHVGVLKVLEQESIPVDIVVGASVGAIVGALYCAGMSISEIEKLGHNTGWDKLTNVSNAALVKLLVAEQLLSTEKMERYLRSFLGTKRIEDLDIPFACVATDIRTGEKVIFKEGELLTAIRASATIPGLFSPVEYRHRYLVDGGLVDNLPTDIARMMGADIVIAVPVNTDFSDASLETVLQVLNQAIYVQGLVINDWLMKEADIAIEPKVKEISAIDLWRSTECIEAGEIAARSSVDAVKRLIIDRTVRLERYSDGGTVVP